MLSCKNIVRLMSSSEALPIFKKVELRMHLLMCISCANYSKHLQMISDSVKGLVGKRTQVDKQSVSKLEQEIFEKLKGA